MRILVVLGGRIFFRFVDGVVRELAADGHSLELWVPNPPHLAIERCRAEVTSLAVSRYGEESWAPGRGVNALRHLRAYRHWLEPEHRWPDFLRRRWATTEFGFPRSLRGVVRLLGHERFDRLLALLPTRVLSRWERRLPANPHLVRRLVEAAPDLVVATPFIYPAPRRPVNEVEVVKAAQRLGIPTAVMVASWDNLSMKGVFYIEPDLVLVWNEIQRREAERFHGLAPERVAVTGAPLFDRWFERRFELPRPDFLARAGLGPGDDYLFYVESSAAAGEEHELVHRLAAALDGIGAPPSLRLVVRRHPSRRDPWPALAHRRLLLFPAASTVPDTDEARVDFYNSLAHASAVVGVNTTVFLEAAIVDRPTVALLDPDKAYFQEGMAHFRYLLDAGFLELAREPAAAAERLVALAGGEDRRREERRAFVRSFLRPFDDDRTASRVSAEALVERFSQQAARRSNLEP